MAVSAPLAIRAPGVVECAHMAPPTRRVKLCLKCGERIPATVLIEGKRRSMWVRKYCLTCSPFGARNNQSLEKVRADGKKQCTGCTRDFPLKEFERHRTERGKRVRRFENRCRSCLSNTLLDARRAIKKTLVELLGGKCIACGYARCVDALSFHHRDPKQKDFELSRKPSRRGVVTAALRAEARKCELLCLNCHAERHALMRATSGSIGRAAAPPS